MTGHIEIFSDPAALARHVAEWITSAAIAAKETFRVALSGGSTPKTLYQLLASDEFRNRFPWQRVSWYFGDERFVSYDDPESNYRMVREAMFAKAVEIHSKKDAIMAPGALIKDPISAISFGFRTAAEFTLTFSAPA